MLVGQVGFHRTVHFDGVLGHQQGQGFKFSFDVSFSLGGEGRVGSSSLPRSSLISTIFIQ